MSRLSAMWLVCLILSSGLFGCLTKAPETPQALITQPISTQAADEPVNRPETGEYSDSQDPYAPSLEEETVPSETVTELVEEEDHPDEVSQQIDPHAMLEAAMEASQAATDEWKVGRIEEALTYLDAAYESMLQIHDGGNADLLQGKENLRLLISKRIVEIYASRRMTAGSLERAIPIVMNEHVEREIKSFQTRERRFFLESYARSGKYRPMILEALRREGLPEQLSWLPLIESGFKVRALSRARALGLWQFIPSTGLRYGLDRDKWIDERMDPEKATEGAIAYLRELHDMFGDWLSALAAYNCGEARVMRAIKSQHINYLDDFWDLYQKLPRETARYVPRFIATLIILQDPEKYGIELPPLEEPEQIENQTIERSVRLIDLDQLAELPQGTLSALNPELRYKITPDKPYELKVPVAQVERIASGVDSLKTWEVPAEQYGYHRVRRGESLSAIANKYRTSVTNLVRANNLPNKHRIWPGQRLKIPGRGGSPSVASSTSSSNPGSVRITHQVKRGDSLWLIARHYKTSVDQIKALNQLSSNHLKIGQRLVIQQGNAAKAASSTYRVRRGDTLAKIAKKHRVTLSALLAANNMSKRDTIYPNQELIVP